MSRDGATIRRWSGAGAVTCRRRRVALALALVLGLAGSACGLPQDDEPQVITRDELPPELFEEPTTSQSPSPDTGNSQVVFLLKTIDEQTSPSKDCPSSLLIPAQSATFVSPK